VSVEIAARVVTDRAGNANYPTAAPFTFDYDTMPPTVTVTPEITSDTTPTVSGTVSDATGIASVDVLVNGWHYAATVGGGSSPWSWQAQVTHSSLPQGIYDVAVTAIDLAENTGNDSTTNELR